jgi:hypothetical protein
MHILAAAVVGLACLGASFLLGKQAQVNIYWWKTIVFVLLPLIGFWSLAAAGLLLIAGSPDRITGQIGWVGEAVLGAVFGLVFGLLHSWQFYREARTGDEKMGGYLVVRGFT